MKMYCIAHDMDTVVGLRLTGIEGIVVKTQEEADNKIEEVLENGEIGILIVTGLIYDMSKEKLDEIQENKKIPLIVRL